MFDLTTIKGPHLRSHPTTPSSNYTWSNKSNPYTFEERHASISEPLTPAHRYAAYANHNTNNIKYLLQHKTLTKQNT